MTESILVLEDQPEMRTLLAEILREEGYQVEEAESGESALRALRRQGFDLIVADIRMEGINGLDVLERAREEYPQVYGMVVTGYSSEPESVRALQLGVRGYLRKPFELAEFLAAVRRLLSERRRLLEISERVAHYRRLALDLLSRPERPWAAAFAHDLALELSLDVEAAEEAALALLLGKLEPRPTLPSRLATLLEGHDLPQARVVSLASLANELRQTEPDSLALSVDEVRPGEYRPGELVALDRVWRGGGQSRPSVTRRDLLTLARALLASRPESATRQLLELVELHPLTREAVEARLLLARLEAQPASRWVEQAVACARAIGPQLEALAMFWGGLALQQRELPESAGWFERCREPLLRHGFIGLEARAALALAELEGPGSQRDLEPALSTLLRPEHLAELTEAAGRLLPYLLERRAQSADGVLKPALQRLLSYFSSELTARLAKLSPPARLLAVEMLIGYGGSGAREALSRLAQDADAAVAAAAQRALAGAQRAAPPLIRALSLGTFEVFRGEVAVTETQWKSRKIKYLGAFLVSRRARPVTEEAVLDEFWPDNPVKGRNSLYAATSVLRKALRHPDEMEDSEVIVRQRGTLQLNPARPLWHDLDEILNCSAAVAQLDPRVLRPDGVLAKVQQALSWSRGSYLEGCYMEWAIRLRDRVEQEVLRLRVFLSWQWHLRRRYEEALEQARALLELDPCHQEGHLVAIQALAGMGRPEEALRQFRACEKTLAEYDLEVGIPLLEAYHRVHLSI